MPDPTRPPRASAAGGRLAGAAGGGVPEGRGRVPWTWILLALLVGLGLRLWNLPAQVVAGDEVHEVRNALQHDLGEILTAPRLDPYASPPLSAVFRLALDAGFEPTEMHLRAPSLLCGAALLVLLPVFAARRLGAWTGVIVAGLVATSPYLVLYSRMVRSYAPMLLAAVAALVALDGWWRRPNLGKGAAFVVLGAGAVAIHPGATPFVASAYGSALGAGVLGRRRGPGLRSLALLGLALGLATLAILVPARTGLVPEVAEKHQFEPFRVEAPRAAFHLLAGTRSTAVAAVFWLVALAGLVRLGRRDVLLAGSTATVVAGHLVGLALLAPSGLWEDLPFVRFVLVLLPVLLLWVAEGLRPPAGLSRPGRGGWAAGVLTALVLLVASGPLVDRVFRTGSFAHHSSLLAFHPGGREEPKGLAASLEPLLAQLEPGPWLELPFPRGWGRAPVFYEAQRIHGRRVLVSMGPPPLPAGPPLDLRNQVALHPEAFLRSEARYLVVHRDVEREQIAFGLRIKESVDEDPWDHYRRQATVFRRRLRHRWGSPVASTEHLEVWDLDAARAAFHSP